MERQSFMPLRFHKRRFMPMVSRFFANIHTPNRVFLFSVLMLFSFLAQTQTAGYWVFFTDKNQTSFDPYEYFDAKAIERRVRHNIPIAHITDYPVNAAYSSKIEQVVIEMLGQTRWFNAVAVLATVEQIQFIEQFKFVKNVQPIVTQQILCSVEDDWELSDFHQYVLEKQTSGMQGNMFTKAGFTGKGVRIAVFDGGFPAVDEHPVFEHVRSANRIIATYDFVKNRPNVYKYSSHGTACMSCITGIYNEQFMGLAIDAEFLLARTEKNTEPFSEEVNWMEAMEWADKNGAHIISSSLGYTSNRYFNENMDGKQALVTRAANMAAAKGILVVTAMGNDGDSNWKYMGAPADADSVISVGGLSPRTDYMIDFSSFGPTADMRLKPNVCGYGQAITAKENGIGNSYGTSFATPLVAGFAACAMQANPNLTNMELKREIEKSGHLFPYFDYAHGYGMPQASYFTRDDFAHNGEPTFLVTENEKEIVITTVATSYVPTKIGGNMLYYHIRNADGTLAEYAVVEPYRAEVLRLDKAKMAGDKTLMLYFNDYTEDYRLNELNNNR